MSAAAIIALVLAALVVLIFLRMPVGIALLFTGMVGMSLFFGWQQGTSIGTQKLFSHMNRFEMISLPLFMLMGNILARGGLGERLFAIFDAFLRHVRGGIGIGIILTCTLMAAMMGSSIALAASVAPFAVENLRRLGYSDRLATGIVSGGATLGLLIPPSGIMILYGVMTEQSIGELFMAGVIPGLIASAMFCGYVYWTSARQRKGETAAPATWPERWRALRRGWVGLIIPFGIIAAIYTGLATATEAASIGCLLALLGTTVIHRTLRWKDLLGVLHRSAVGVASVLLVITGAVAFAAFVIQSGFSAMVSNFFATHSVPLWAFLVITILVMLGEGCFLEGAAICLIMVPILHASLLHYNYSLVLYCVVMVVCIQCALLTPPIGLNFFVVHNICKERGISCELGTVIRGGMPFFFMLLATLALTLLYPPLALWLPSTMF